jgi:hypothetical protein
MANDVYDVGYLAGRATAALINLDKGSTGSKEPVGGFPLDSSVSGPDLTQVEKEKLTTVGKETVFDPGRQTNPSFQIHPDSIIQAVDKGDAKRIDGRSILERLGARIGESVIVAGSQKPDPAPEGVIELHPTKGLGDPSPVDLINQDLQNWQQSEQVVAQAAPAVQAGAGVTLQSGAGGLSGLAGPVLSFLSVPFSSIMIWLAGTQDVADATLDNISPEQLAQVQERMAHAARHDETLGGRLVFELGADGFLRASDAETGEVVVGPDGQILSPELLTALTLGYLGQAEWGDPIPGVTRLPSNIFTVGQSDPMTTAFDQAREINRQGNFGDLLVVVDLVLRNGESAQGFIRGGFDHLVGELLNLAGIGMLPENTSAEEILRRSGIELSAELGQLLTTIAVAGGSADDFARQLENLSTNILPRATIIEPRDDRALPEVSIDVTAEVIEREIERDPNDIRNAVPPDADSSYGILRFIPQDELK